MILLTQESCLNTETPVGGEWGRFCINIFMIKKHHVTQHHTMPLVFAYIGPSNSPYIVKYAKWFWTKWRLRIATGKCQPWSQYMVHQSRCSQYIQGVHAMHKRGSDSTIYCRGRSPLFSVIVLHVYRIWGQTQHGLLFCMFSYSIRIWFNCRGWHSTIFESYRTSKLVIERNICHFGGFEPFHGFG